MAWATLSWALALFGAACLLLTGLGIAVGAQPLVVRTGSMVPRFPIGTVVVVRREPASTIRAGEVIAVRRSDGRRIMHRVQSVRDAGGGSRTVVLKGDRNRTADPAVTVAKIERPVVVVPWLGKPVAWVDNAWVQYWLGVLTSALALSWLLGRRRRAEGAPRPRAQGAP